MYSEQKDYTTSNWVGTSTPANQWEHVAMVMDFNADQMRYYLNGDKKGTIGPVTANSLERTIYGNKLVLGTGDSSDLTVDGAMELDELFVYDQPFTDNQILDVYQSYSN